MSLEIVIDMPEPAWAEAVSGIEALAADTIRRAFAAAMPPALGGAAGRVEIGVTLAGDDHLRLLNRDYRGKDTPTNVLSFPLWNGLPPSNAIPVLLGDIVVAFQTVRREAIRDGKPFEHHIRHMLVHGLLHLLGHDHEAESEADAMEALECKILVEFGVSDPYLINSEVF